MPYVTAQVLDQIAQEHLAYLQELSGGTALRVTDKLPGNYAFLGLIEMLFPNARIIHCRRDPLDNCLSCYFQNFATGHQYTCNLADLGSYHVQYQKTMAHLRNVISLPMLDVQYEELVGDLEGVSRSIIEFCGLEWDDRCLRFHENRRVVTTASYDQVRTPIYTRSVGRWRPYRDHLAPLIEALGLKPEQLD
jgi:hypothetical protein